MSDFPNPLSLPLASRTRIWGLLQTQLEDRISGKVVTGSSAGQSFSTQNLSWKEFMSLYNSWSDVMAGVSASSGGISQTRPDFSRNCR